jgi:hypothetical protein
VDETNGKRNGEDLGDDSMVDQAMEEEMSGRGGVRSKDEQLFQTSNFRSP